MDPRRTFGNEGERTAEELLLKKGYLIVDRQYSTRLGEIDLVAKDGNELVFVEVKARHDLEYGYPEEAVTPSKLRKIAQTAELYLREKGLLDVPYRIDVVSILLNQDPPDILHLEGVS